VALAAVVAVLGMVFAVGALRIRLADDGSAASVAPASPDSSATSQPSATVELPAPDTSVEAIPAIDFQTVELPAEKAILSPGLVLQADKLAHAARPGGGRGRKGRVGPPDVPPQPQSAITGWHSEEDCAEWSVTLPKQGVYEVEIVCASLSARTTALAYVITLGDQELKAQTEPGGRASTSYKMLTAGTAKLAPGEIHVRFHPAMNLPATSLRLQSIRLIPAS
jgi:hypothetical protein